MTEVPVRDAATVMLVRDGSGGRGRDTGETGGAGETATGGRLEVFMVRRSPASVFAGGAHVFPGGAVDEADRHADLEPYCSGRSDAEASVLLGLDRGGLAFWVAAVRESFEEAGVLLAERVDGSPLRLDDTVGQQRFRRHRRELYAGRRLVDMCVEEGLRLAVGSIHYFSHWITPRGGPRRFDTRFFVAATPEGQEALHDQSETVASCWLRPADALALGRAGQIHLIRPTIKNLQALARFESAAELLSAAASVAEVPMAVAQVAADGGGLRILLPGDPGYERAVAR